MELVSAAPRVRTRNSRDRQQEQLADLAVLNERLAGDAGLVRPWEVSPRHDEPSHTEAVLHVCC